MKAQPKSNSSAASRTFDGRLAGYLTAAGAVTAVMATDAKAIVVGNSTVQPFGINGAVNIDFNKDGQTDFQIDHDRVTLPSGGPTVDYLQIDKNDINGESNPLAFDPGPNCCFAATPFSDGATARNAANDSAYVINGPQGSYPAALTAGAPIGPAQTFDFQETDNFQASGKWIRANRLIDEDATQIDQVLGGRPASGVQVPFSGPNFTGLAPTDVRYLGVKMNLNGTGLINYGWVGVRITNEADATGEVVGYAYETTPGVGIAAGNVPEPTTLCSALFGGIAVFGFLCKRLRRR
jgi:hypothetical protein